MIPVITIDGPSGAGKGTICHLLAQRLGFQLLDSGALYRLTALAAERQGASFADKAGLAQVAAGLDVVFKPLNSGTKIILAGDDVTQTIREERVGMNASIVAAVDEVREALLQRQRDFAVMPGLVADGRDMGTTVFPSAPIKVFLTASSQERARRRVLQLEASDINADYDQILCDIERRDKQDRERLVSPLVPASDAVLIDCTELTVEEVLEKVIELSQQLGS